MQSPQAHNGTVTDASDLDPAVNKADNEEEIECKPEHMWY